MVALLLAALLLSSCGGSSSTVTPEVGNIFDGLDFGTDETLEVVTWNLEAFAKNNSITADLVVQAVQALDVDIVALQEIENETYFNKVVAGLEGWNGLRASGASYDINLAYIYRAGGPVQVQSIYEIKDGHDDWYAFPRPPLVMELTFDGTDYVVINNHYKAMGDATSQARRLEASTQLHAYVAANFTNRRVIIVGDLNDELGDAPGDNVFAPFLDDPTGWKFTDMAIALDISALWSYPGWPSHLDHILVTDEVFGDLAGEAATVEVLPLHAYFTGGLGTYDKDLSDHLPVAVRLVPTADNNPFTEARFGTQASLDCATWSLNGFGDDGDNRVAGVASVVEALSLDLIALQDVTTRATFSALLTALPDWTGYRQADASAGSHPAWLVRLDSGLLPDSNQEILTDHPREFPIPPLLLQFSFDGRTLVAVNVDLPAGGDGILVPTDPDDPETIRRDAMQLLDDYLRTSHADARIILLGNFNDRLDDPLADNVFLDMLLDDESWDFTDLLIADGEAAGWTMPGAPLHPDHLALSSELFGVFREAGSEVQVSPLHTLLPGGWAEYENTISDHLPLMVKLVF